MLVTADITILSSVGVHVELVKLKLENPVIFKNWKLSFNIPLLGSLGISGNLLKAQQLLGTSSGI